MILIIVCIILSSGFLMDPPVFIVISTLTEEEIHIDGYLNETAWQSAQQLPLSNNLDGTRIRETLFSSYAMTCHDRDNLYIAFVNHDQHIFSSFRNRDEFLWEEEAVEVFIDTDEIPSTYIELEVSPRNVVFDSFITDTAKIDLVVTPGFDLEGWRTAVSVHGTVNDNSDHDSLWTVEMAIPFTSLEPDFKMERITEYHWRINFYRIDRDDLGPTNYAWSPTYRRFHTPSKFGTILFR